MVRLFGRALLTAQRKTSIGLVFLLPPFSCSFFVEIVFFLLFASFLFHSQRGQTFLKLNHDLFDRYSTCSTPLEVVSAQNAWLQQMEQERNQRVEVMYPPSQSEDERRCRRGGRGERRRRDRRNRNRRSGGKQARTKQIPVPQPPFLLPSQLLQLLLLLSLLSPRLLLLLPHQSTQWPLSLLMYPSHGEPSPCISKPSLQHRFRKL